MTAMSAAAQGRRPDADRFARGSSRYELKFVGPAAHGERARALLEPLCLPDPEHPENRVHTLYLDSARLRHYADKTHGDYRKTKLRLRWYDDSAVPDADGLLRARAWLEIKAKEGSLGWKERAPVELTLPPDPRRLDPGPIDQLARSLLGSPLRAACWLSYRRLRLIEPWRHARVALDRDIRVEWCADWLPRRRDDAQLPWFIVEIKGDSLQPSPSLLRSLGRVARKSAFSKYAMCIDYLRGGAS